MSLAKAGWSGAASRLYSIAAPLSFSDAQRSQAQASSSKLGIHRTSPSAVLKSSDGAMYVVETACEHGRAASNNKLNVVRPRRSAPLACGAPASIGADVPFDVKVSL